MGKFASRETPLRNLDDKPRKTDDVPGGRMKDRRAEQSRFYDERRTKVDPAASTEKGIKQQSKWYSITQKSKKKVLELIEQDAAGVTILDYCCGSGKIAIMVAEKTSCRIIGIDISGVSIANAAQSAADEGLTPSLDFLVMDAEKMTFDDGYFDVAYCVGALHHLDIDAAYSELARVLKPGGKLIMNEPLVYNPLIHYYRKKTPHLRTEWELDHILRKREIVRAREYFHDVNVLGFYHLFTIVAVFFKNTRFFAPVLKTMQAIDSVVLKIPGVRWLAWQIIYVAENPRS